MTNVTTTEALASQAQSFTDIRAQWKALSAARKITSADIAALCIYRAIIRMEGKEGAISRLKKSFTPITNPIKLENGAYPNGGLHFALYTLISSIRHKRNTPEILSWLTDFEKSWISDIARSINAQGKEII